MPKPLMRSVLGSLVDERRRPKARRAVTAALAAYGESAAREDTISAAGHRRSLQPSGYDGRSSGRQGRNRPIPRAFPLTRVYDWNHLVFVGCFRGKRV